MRKATITGVIGILACSLVATYADSKDDILDAAKKLSQTSYSWKTTIDLGANSNFQPGPTEGKHAKNGIVYISREFNGNTFEAYHKGDKTAIKRDGEWQVMEARPGQGAARGAGRGRAGQGAGRGGGRGFGFFGAQAPTTELENALKQTKDFTESNGALVADLTDEGAKSMLTFRGRGRGAQAGGGQANRPEPKNAKGSLKVWLKDGNLAKYSLNVQGTITTPNGDEREVNRTTTIEFKDVGNTKVEVPQEVQDKLSS